MRSIVLFGAEDCHKTQFYNSWFLEHKIPYVFLDIHKDKTAALWLSSLYTTHKSHFPTVLIGKKRLRNPSINDLKKWLLAISIEELPDGYSDVLFRNKKYGVSKQSFNQGNSSKVYANGLVDSDFISFNYYITKAGRELKPCEMPEPKVLEFLMEYQCI